MQAKEREREKQSTYVFLGKKKRSRGKQLKFLSDRKERDLLDSVKILNANDVTHLSGVAHN